MKEGHPRHRLLRPYYLGQRTYFLTICTGRRAKLLTEERIARPLIVVMHEQFRRKGFSVYAYCLMPDHCHILAAGLAETCVLSEAVRAFKGVSTATARCLGIRNLWQRDYYDHILRSQESIDAAASYIFENPVRAGLVKDQHDWPFSGSFVLEWKNFDSPSSKFVPPWK